MTTTFRVPLAFAFLCCSAPYLAGQSTALAAEPAPLSSTCRETETTHLRYGRPYVAVRRLEVENAKSGKRAWMDVRTELTAARTLRVEILDEGGSGYLRDKVLRDVLNKEQQLVAQGIPARAPLTTADYNCSSDTADGDSVAVKVAPLRRALNLIDGEMVMSPATGAVSHVRGQLSKSPSFWIRRVDVDWTYEKVGGAMMAVSLVSVAQVRMFGQATFRMTYRYESVDGRPVALTATTNDAPK